ncbi:MAG: 6-hydroxymethylpterin diphosphokinase MptE-like protein [Candidatus Hydrothermarchaeales archaeon]
MRYEDWEPLYRKILEEFEFSEEMDLQSAKLLDKYLKKPDLGEIMKKIRDKEVSIFGAGPSLDRVEEIPNCTEISADGATSFLVERGIIPDIIVTDLDGNLGDLVYANAKGSTVILHAHGDNIDKIAEHAGNFKDLYGTTQTRPFGNLLNFGGFTDGDRAVFIAEHFKPKKIVLYGMDFDAELGRYSFSSNREKKRKKLKWAKILIGHLKGTTKVSIMDWKEV